ncbi:hypothetical protein [Streptomyces sp. NPDC058486]|uniref:hypothetical protein n=1 Tax=unclassified Streptomyces TaxID=2593676 RepID=UPI003650BC27
MELRRPSVLLAPLALASLLVSGCSGGDPKPSATPSVSASSGSATGAPAEKKQEKQKVQKEQGDRAREAVGSWEDPDFLEAGVAPVAEGGHVRAALVRGRTYRLSVACVGTGAVKLTVADLAPETVKCDGVADRRHIRDAPARLRVTVTGAAGATGMVAWQIDSVPSADGTDRTAQGDGGDDGDDAETPKRKVRR